METLIEEKKKIRFGVIGIRAFGRRHMDAIMKSNNAELVLICDILEDIAIARSEEIGVPYCTDYHEMLTRKDIDAVTLALPDQVHPQITIDALRAGKHVLCEKPMALKVEECKEMVRAADESEKKLMVGQVCRYAPGFIMAKRMVEEGEIGKLFFVESEYAHDYSKLTDATWRFDPVAPRHPMIGGGCHAVDLLRWIAGDPTEVFAYGNHTVLKTWPVDDCTIAIMKFPNNVIGKVFNSIGCKRKYTMRTVLYGDKGTIIVDNSTPWLSLFKSESAGTEKYMDKEVQTIECKIPVALNSHNIIGEIEDFCNAIYNNTPVKTDGIQGASTVAVCEAIVNSAKLGEKIQIDYNFR